MLSRTRQTENAISAETHRTCYLSRGSQKMLSRPRLTERAISAGAHRRCYLGRGSQNVLSEAFFFFKFYSGSPARALIKPIYFYRIGVWKSWKILDVILSRWFWQFTIHRRVGARTSHLSSARKNVPSQLGAWKRPILARRVKTSHLDSARENVSSRAFRV